MTNDDNNPYFLIGKLMQQVSDLNERLALETSESFVCDICCEDHLARDRYVFELCEGCTQIIKRVREQGAKEMAHLLLDKYPQLPSMVAVQSSPELSIEQALSLWRESK